MVLFNKNTEICLASIKGLTNAKLCLSVKVFPLSFFVLFLVLFFLIGRSEYSSIGVLVVTINTLWHFSIDYYFFISMRPKKLYKGTMGNGNSKRKYFKARVP